MDEWTAEDLSPEESELIIDFVEWLGEFDRQILERQTIDGDNKDANWIEAFEYLMPYISEDATEFDSQLFRLYRLRNEISVEPVFEYDKENELPSDAVITPDELNQFLKKEELEEFFTISGQIVEMLTVELLMNEVIDESRESKSVQSQIKDKSQSEREWLLYVTGVISNGEKSEIRRVYSLRNPIVHHSNGSESFLEKVNVPSDIERAMNAINDLHEELHGMELKHRVGDLIIK